MKTIQKTLISILSLLIAGMADAAIVKGRLIDPDLNEAEPFATVRIFKGATTGKPLYTVLSDIDGVFSQDIKKNGKYTIVVSSVGKEDLLRDIDLSDGKDLDLGTLEMKSDATMIQELEVVARKPLVKMTADQMTYNVAEDSESRTQTLLDMLRKVPMVTVDGDDNITVNGSSSFQVYVDGKPSLLFSGNPSQMFKAMPASAVKSIEVVTNPGARYDAEGAGGVLNLVMDRQSAGAQALDKAYNVSVGVRAGNKGFGGNIYANAKTGKLTTSLNAIYTKNTPGETTVDTERISTPSATTAASAQGEGGNSEIMRNFASSETKLPFTMGNLSMEYEIDSLTTIGASIALNSFNVKSPATTLTSMEGTGYDFSYGSDTDMKTNRMGITGSVDFSHFFDGNQKNHLTATYQIQSERNDTKYVSKFDAPQESPVNLTDRTSNNKERTMVHVAQADFTSRLNENNTLSAGAKMTLRSAKSNADYYLAGVYDEDGSMRYDNHNTIGALYGEYTFSADKFSAKGGLRYEHTWQDVKYHSGLGSDYSTNYGILVPSATLSYSLTSGSNLGLNYNMRISRPGISYLNPYVEKYDPTVLTYGNPDLDVEKSHNVGLVYNMFSTKLMMNMTLSNNYTGNGIEQYSFMKDNVLNTTYGNIVKRNNTGLNAYINWMPTVKTRIIFNGGVSYTDIRSRELGMSNSGWQGNAMLGVQQTLPLDFNASAFLIASTKSHTLQGWSSGFQIFTFNVSKSFLDKNLNISAGLNTGLSKGGKLTMETYTATKNFTNHSKVSVPMLGFTVGVTYTFGNSKNIALKNKKIIDSDFIEQKSDTEQINNLSSGTNN